MGKQQGRMLANFFRSKMWEERRRVRAIVLVLGIAALMLGVHGHQRRLEQAGLLTTSSTSCSVPRPDLTVGFSNSNSLALTYSL